jgi:hypothetical protein
MKTLVTSKIYYLKNVVLSIKLIPHLLGFHSWKYSTKKAQLRAENGQSARSVTLATRTCWCGTQQFRKVGVWINFDLDSLSPKNPS